LEYRYAEGNIDRLSSLPAELVQLKLDVIVTTSGNSARAVTQATRTIPVVLTTAADPVKTGLAESLARPGRNVTGLSIIEEDLSGKRVEILKETFPKMTRMAYLWNPVAVSYSAGGATSGNLSYDVAKKAAGKCRRTAPFLQGRLTGRDRKCICRDAETPARRATCSTKSADDCELKADRGAGARSSFACDVPVQSIRSGRGFDRVRASDR